MPPLTLRERVTWSPGTGLGMIALRAYLVIGPLLLVVKGIQIGRGSLIAGARTGFVDTNVDIARRGFVFVRVAPG